MEILTNSGVKNSLNIKFTCKGFYHNYSFIVKGYQYLPAEEKKYGLMIPQLTGDSSLTQFSPSSPSSIFSGAGNLFSSQASISVATRSKVSSSKKWERSSEKIFAS